MSNQSNITSKEDFLSRLEAASYKTYYIKELDATIKYKKIDLVESAVVNKNLPFFLESQVMEGFRTSMSGKQPAESQVELSPEDLKEILIKATEAWEKYVVDPVLGSVEIQSIPANVRLEWYIQAITSSYDVELEGGGQTDLQSVANFPKDRPTKRKDKAAVPNGTATR